MSTRCFVILLAMVLAGCSAFSHTNIPEEAHILEPPERCEPIDPAGSRATFSIDTNRGDSDTLFILAFSGGGSRAAYLSASVMLAMQDRNHMLDEVDAISSVSGGSLPAAYYIISSDGEPSPYGRVWDADTVRELMGRNYTARWFGDWFWPTNIGKYWFTAFDRTDIMAQTLADNLYDTRPLGRDLKMGDLLEDRPFLILNATNGTSGQFGKSFTFTMEDFAKIRSNLQDYDLGRAVMGTATFPGVFSYMTLENYDTEPGEDPQYTHIFDGGNFDNLGLDSVDRILCTLENIPEAKYGKLIVVLVDAFTGRSGVSDDNARSRNPVDLVIDTNAIDATDSLLSSNRTERLKSFKMAFQTHVIKHPQLDNHAVFYHLQFSDSTEYGEALAKIPTNFTISEDNRDLIDDFVQQMLDSKNSCLAIIETIMAGGLYESEDKVCEYSIQ